MTCLAFKSDAAIAGSFNVGVIEDNEHGRRCVDRKTVFFMPHCGKTLYENVLACNWGPAMEKLVIIGNRYARAATSITRWSKPRS